LRKQQELRQTKRTPLDLVRPPDSDAHDQN
jgi:hypothetical protein